MCFIPVKISILGAFSYFFLRLPVKIMVLYRKRTFGNSIVISIDCPLWQRVREMDTSSYWDALTAQAFDGVRNMDVTSEVKCFFFFKM